jgi:beta-lactamase regulating signal transducer with metallopeptidase domain/protocatechuate 3,4-dioxygenase beta subunit
MPLLNSVLSSAFLLWALDVLILVTVCTAAALGIGLRFRGDALTRYLLLFAALLVCCLAPISAMLMPETPLARLYVPEPTIAREPNLANAELPNADSNSADLPGNSQKPDTVSAAPAVALVEAHKNAVADTAWKLAVPYARWQNALRLFCWFWIAGSYAHAARLFGDWLRVRRIIRAARPLTNADVNHEVSRAARFFGMRTQPTVLSSNAINGPFVTGTLRPVVVLPTGLEGQIGREELYGVLVHELAHIARRDTISLALQNLVRVMYWAHPLVYWLNRELTRAREECCDNHALAVVNAAQYSRTLLNIAERMQPTATCPWTVATFTTLGHLEGRVHGLLDERRSRTTRLSMGRAAFVACFAQGLVVASAFVAINRAHSENPLPAIASSTIAEKTNGTVRYPVETPLTSTELSGRVVDLDGEPVAGVKVDAWTGFPGNETTTDADGTFKLTGFKVGDTPDIYFSKVGYTPNYFASTSNAPDWTIQLGNKTYLEGTVTSPDGKPVADALVLAKFNRTGDGGSFVMYAITTETRTDQEGRFCVHLKPDRYDVQVYAKGVGAGRQSNVIVAKDTAASCNIQLHPSIHFEANVVDSVTGEPVEGFVLYTWEGPVTAGKSNKEGRLIIDDLAPGKLRFHCGGGEPRESKGRVTYRPAPFGRWWSDAAEVQWERFEPGESGFQPNFDDLTFNLAVGMKPVKIVAERAVTITGAVTDPNGDPVAGASVDPARTGSGNSLSGDTRFRVSTDRKGNYRAIIPASGTGRYNLTTHDGKYEQTRNWANGVTEPFQTKPGQVIEHLDLQLTRPAVIRGTIFHGSVPAANVEVQTTSADLLENRYYNPSTKTNADGSYELKFVRGGKHIVQVEPFFLLPSQNPYSIPVEVESGGLREGVDIHLDAMESRDYAVRVVDEKNIPAAGVAIALAGWGLAIDEKTFLARKTDDNGRATFSPADTLYNSNGRQSIRSAKALTPKNWTMCAYAADYASGRAGMTELRYNHFEPEPILKLRPATSVNFTLNSSALKEKGISRGTVRVMVFKNEHTKLGTEVKYLEIQMLESDRSEFSLLLPPGEYSVMIHGNEVHPENRELSIPESNLEPRLLAVDLKPADWRK